MNNTALWICQALLSGLFTLSGVLKATKSERWLVSHGNTGVDGLPPPLIRFIGLAELAGAVGLILPWVLGIAPILTPLAALCLGLIMPPAAVIHWYRHEGRNVAINFAVLAVCAFVAYGRLTSLVGSEALTTALQLR